MPAATYFEIPVTDLDRAVAFYGHVFGVSLERADIDGNAMALFPVTPDGRGASGALAMGESYVPSLDGTRIYLAVDNIEAALARVWEMGGEVLYPKTLVGEWGYVAEFRDSEGNRIALSAANG